MFVYQVILAAMLLVTGTAGNHSTVFGDELSRKHRASNDGALRFEPQPFSKKLELNSSGKIHCKVAGGISPNVQWYLNTNDSLPLSVTSANGTLLVSSATHSLSGQYTCRATDGEHTIEATISLDVVVSPRVLEPSSGQVIHVSAGQPVWLHCRATGEPQPTTHWDRNTTILQPTQNDVDVEGGANAADARIVLLHNGTLLFRNATIADSDQYGCTAGSAAGLARSELTLIVHPEGEPLPTESSGVGSMAVIVSITVACAYMLLVIAIVLYCRHRKNRGAKRSAEMEMTEGGERLVGEGEEENKPGNGTAVANGRLMPQDNDSGGESLVGEEEEEIKPDNGTAVANGRLMPQDKDYAADNSEVSGVLRVSKKYGQSDHLSLPRSLLSDLITLGRGEFGEVFLGKMDVSSLKKRREEFYTREKLLDEDEEMEPVLRPVLVKALTTNDETQLSELRRQLDVFARVHHSSVVKLLGLCNDATPHYMVLEHTDWGDLKSFLVATRTKAETEEYQSRVGRALPAPMTARQRSPALEPQHRVLLATQLAAAAGCIAAKRLTHRDISARNCVLTSQMHLKLSFASLSRGPHAHEYYKLHDQVIPLRWLPAEAVLEGDYSMKSDVYMYAATVWEIYTKAELPFVKLNDNSVMERLKAGTLEWSMPEGMPPALASLLCQCWSQSAADRPAFADVCMQTATILRDYITGTTHTTRNKEY